MSQSPSEPQKMNPSTSLLPRESNEPRTNIPIRLTLTFSLVLFYALNAFCQPLHLISWNIENLGISKDAVEIRFIAQTIRTADIIALQEVVAGDGGAQAVARIVNELNTMGSSWDYIVSDPTFSSSYKTERYAYLWKKHRVKLAGQAWLQKGEYAVLIDREPYFATFEQNGKKFTLVNFHAITKSKQPETEIKYFKFFPDLYPGQNLIFLGDFNLPQSHTVFNPLKSQGYNPLLIGQKTSLKQTCQSNDCLASEYDNIFYHGNKIQIHDKGIIHFYKQTETFEAACGISDHVPVFMKFSVK